MNVTLVSVTFPLRDPTRQAMYVQRNTEASSSNHCGRGKAINTSITYSECVSVAFVIQQNVIEYKM